MGYLLIFLGAIEGGINSILTKKYVRDTEHIHSSMSIYMFMIYPMATLYYFILAKGEVPLNWPTLWFSVVYALIALGVSFFRMTAMRFASLIYISVFSGAGATVIPFLFELVSGREQFPLSKIVAVCFRLAAVCVPLLGIKKENKSSRKGFMFCILLFFLGGVVNIVAKLYGEHPGVYSDQSFCFWTNMVTLPFIMLFILKTTGIKTIISEGKKIRPLNYFLVVINMMMSNFWQLVTIQILRMVSATIYSVLSSSLGLMVTTLISVILYKEKLKKVTVFSVLFSILAVMASVL